MLNPNRSDLAYVCVKGYGWSSSVARVCLLSVIEANRARQMLCPVPAALCQLLFTN
jgi:hypothetical protein